MRRRRFASSVWPRGRARGMTRQRDRARQPQPRGTGAARLPQAPETGDQYAKDVAAFLMWTAEPKMEARKALGFRAIIFLILLAGLTYFAKKRIWKKLPDPA